MNAELRVTKFRLLSPQVNATGKVQCRDGWVGDEHLPPRSLDAAANAGC